MQNHSRRTLITLPSSILAVAALTGFRDTTPVRTGRPAHPNILLIMVDQMQTPPEGYGPGDGAAQGLKEIFGFSPLSPDNEYTQFFQGFLRLRQNAVVLKKHYTASAASVPSRCSIMTGQYPALTSVTQTDGLFKTTEDVPFLDSLGTPTLGDWFRAAGYTTHYFGKWHVSDPQPPGYLEPWGFSDWESSYPEPHGGTSSNLGVFRDVVFTDNVVDFLKTRGTDTSGGPWFAVGSLVNPHDVPSMPVNWQVPNGSGVVPWKDYPPPLSIPAQGDKSRLDTVKMVVNGDTIVKIFRVDLNPDGFPQNNSSLSPTFTESLVTKPRCQQDYALKWGLAWGAKTDYTFIEEGTDYRSPYPFQLQESYDSAWFMSYNQFYFYCHYLADLQIRKMLHALDSTGLVNNTIVVFMSDHGELGSAHGGMIQKWHNAYEEIVRVPMVISSPLVNSDPEEMREVTEPTSSIDLAPTLLALAGFKEKEVKSNMLTFYGLSVQNSFPGADLSPYIMGTSQGPIIGPDGKPRNGVLFMSSDMITELGTVNPGGYNQNSYKLFQHYVDSTISLGYTLDTGTVRQPNNLNAFCTGDWKIVQYVDPKGILKDEWELYYLTYDPLEEINLVDFSTGIVRNDVSVPGMTHEQLIQKNDSLRNELFRATGLVETNGYLSGATLFQNLPNPFTQETSIRFYLPEKGHVSLTITDQTGREMKVLINQSLPQGFHSFKFNADWLPSGIYFISLKFNLQLLTKKMILMR